MVWQHSWLALPLLATSWYLDMSPAPWPPGHRDSAVLLNTAATGNLCHRVCSCCRQFVLVVLVVDILLFLQDTVLTISFTVCPSLYFC